MVDFQVEKRKLEAKIREAAKIKEMKKDKIKELEELEKLRIKLKSTKTLNLTPSQKKLLEQRKTRIRSKIQAAKRGLKSLRMTGLKVLKFFERNTRGFGNGFIDDKKPVKRRKRS